MFTNTHKQELPKHLFAVGYLSKLIVETYCSDKKLSKLAFLSGIFHDIGMTDPEYQNWIKKRKDEELNNTQYIESGKFSFDKHATYNEISLLISNFIIGTDRSERKKFAQKNGLNNTLSLDTVFHSIYFHHENPLRKEPFDSLFSIYNKGVSNNLMEILNSSGIVLDSVNQLCSDYNLPAISYSINIKNIKEQLIDLDKHSLPDYKKYVSDSEDLDAYVSSSKINAVNNLVRLSLIYADKLISELSPVELSDHIANKTLGNLILTNSDNSSLPLSIKGHIDNFYPDSEKSISQWDASLKLAKKKDISVLSGFPGTGKTSIGLRWAYELNAKKAYWITPRVSVAQGLFEELSSSEYLSGCTIEIFTGEYKISKKNGFEWETKEDDYLTGDIVIITIDQVVSSITTNKRTSIFHEFMSNHVIFDEYHEYSNMESYNLLFAELIQSKKLSNEKLKLLLISATPNYFFTENILEVDPLDIVEIKSLNKSTYKFVFEGYDESTPYDSHPLYKSLPDNSMVISNTATDAQKSFLINHLHESSLLVHSKYSSFDKKDNFKLLMRSFGKNGTNEFSVLRASPVIQASLNITCSSMVSEITHPDNFFQRLGRLDRFGEFSETNILTVAFPASVSSGKLIDKSGKFLYNMDIFKTTCSFYQFLKEHENEVMPHCETFELHKKFYSLSSSVEAIKKDLISSLKKSAKLLNLKISNPVYIKSKAGSSLMNKNIIKKISLRGDSRYIQLAEVFFDGFSYLFSNKYAINNGDKMTLGLSYLLGENSPLNTMLRKHHQIPSFKLSGAKKEYSSSILIEKARDENFPIYASYTPEDISSVNDSNCENSQFYVRSASQPVGCMRKKSLDVIYESKSEKI